MIRDVLVIDCYRLYADALAQLIDRMPGMRVTATATDGAESLWSFSALPPDLVVIGIQSPGPDELESIRAFGRKNPRVKVVLLVDTLDAFRNAFRAEAAGYVLKSDGLPALECALRYAADGIPYFSDTIAGELTRTGGFPGSGKGPDSDPALLTRREWEIIALVAREHSSSEIGEMLCISPMTVNTHRRNLMKKLGVKNALGLVKFALTNTASETAGYSRLY